MPTWIEFAVLLIKCIFPVGLILQLVPLLLWIERKLPALIQDRVGPNRAEILGIRAGGLIHSLADAIKLIGKEDVIPDHVFKPFWVAAPIISVVVGMITFAVVPWGDYIQVTESFRVPLQISQINGGVLYILAITSLGVYGVMLAGWSSNNKYSLLGGLRASAQMVSYELAMGLSLVAMFMVYGTVHLGDIVQLQSGGIWNWGFFRVPPMGAFAFLIFFIAVFAETNRLPFDLPEAEAELVAGYHTEYAALRFALFFLAEYGNMIVGCAVTATLFFGGYNVPFLTGELIREYSGLVLGVMFGGAGAMFFFFAFLASKRGATRFYQDLPDDDRRRKEPMVWTGLWSLLGLVHLGVAVLGLSGVVASFAIGPELVAFVAHFGMFMGKTMIGLMIMIIIRWTLPRFRYDQLMDLGWKWLLPWSLANVMLAGVMLVAMPSLFAFEEIAMSDSTPRRIATKESSYLVEILKGMGITLKHLVRNAREPEGIRTVQYPEVRKPMADRYRGAHRLTTRTDGKVKCVACMCCPTACPAKCITIVAGEDPDDPIEKYPVRFEIDMLRCIYCGFCVEACPKDAIRMDTRIYEINAYTRQDMIHTRDYMRDLMDGDKPTAEAWYRDNPDQAPPGFRMDIERIVNTP